MKCAHTVEKQTMEAEDLMLQGQLPQKPSSVQISQSHKKSESNPVYFFCRRKYQGN